MLGLPTWVFDDDVEVRAQAVLDALRALSAKEVNQSSRTREQLRRPHIPEHVRRQQRDRFSRGGRHA